MMTTNRYEIKWVVYETQNGNYHVCRYVNNKQLRDLQAASFIKKYTIVTHEDKDKAREIGITILTTSKRIL